MSLKSGDPNENERLKSVTYPSISVREAVDTG